MNITDRVDKREYTYFVECLKTSPDTFVLAKLAVIWDRFFFFIHAPGPTVDNLLSPPLSVILYNIGRYNIPTLLALTSNIRVHSDYRVPGQFMLSIVQHKMDPNYCSFVLVEPCGHSLGIF